MTRKEIIRQQLISGIPASWITDDLLEAVELAWGGRVLKSPAPELADPKHAAALCRFAGRMEEK